MPYTLEKDTTNKENHETRAGAKGGEVQAKSGRQRKRKTPESSHLGIQKLLSQQVLQISNPLTDMASTFISGYGIRSALLNPRSTIYR